VKKEIVPEIMNDLPEVTGFPRILKIHFPYFFNTKLKKFTTVTSLHLLKFLITKLYFARCINIELLCFQ